MQLLRQSTVATVYVGPVLDASGAAVTTAVVGDFRLVKNGTAATLSGATVTHDANGYYTIALTTGNTDTVGRLNISVGNASMSMATFGYSVLLPSVFDALITNAANTTNGLPLASGSGVNVTQWNGTAVTTATVRADLINIAGAAVATGTAQLGVNVVNWGATAVGSALVRSNIIQANGVAVPSTAGRIEANTTHWGGTAIASALVRSDLINIAGAAVSASTAQLGVNVVNAGGTAWGSGAITAASIAADAIGASELAADAVTEIATAVRDINNTAPAALSLGASVNSAASAGDPWATSLPGAYAAGTAGNIIGNRVDAAITSRMATYTQPTGFLAATFPTTVASTTNITSATGVTLAPTTGLGNQTANITGNLSGSVGSVTGAVGSVTGNVGGNVVGSVGSISGVTFPANFGALGINVSGHVTRVTTVDTATATTTVNGLAANVITTASIANSAFTNAKFATGAIRVAGDEFGTTLVISNLATVGQIPAEFTSATFASTGVFSVAALANAPAGGGGGGGTDWTADERTAIRSILGVPTSGTTPATPSVGAIKRVFDKTDLITGSDMFIAVDRVTNGTIVMYKNESTSVTVPLSEDTTSKTLRFTVEDAYGTDILTIANASITRNSSSFTVTIPNTVTDELANHTWSLRDITGGINRLVRKGVLTVQAAADI